MLLLLSFVLLSFLPPSPSTHFGNGTAFVTEVNIWKLPFLRPTAKKALPLLDNIHFRAEIPPSLTGEGDPVSKKCTLFLWIAVRESNDDDNKNRCGLNYLFPTSHPSPVRNILRTKLFHCLSREMANLPLLQMLQKIYKEHFSTVSACNQMECPSCLPFLGLEDSARNCLHYG